ncbi:MAG: DUF4221 domain-containing protein [Oscillibacter sp.]|nr:DUF4221 domain-containing protein [Oscillibacter sp.]
MKHKIIAIWIGINICSSCFYENKNIADVDMMQDKCELIKVGEKRFVPDEKTPADWRNIALLNFSDSCVFLLWNTLTSEMNFFNYKTAELIKQQKLPIYADGFYVHAPDTIYFYSYYKGQIYEFHDLASSSSYNTYQVPLTNKRRIPGRVNIFNGIYPFNNTLYMTSYTLGETEVNKRYTNIGFNRHTHEVRYDFEYPKEYLKANWGGGIYRIGYSCFNKEHNKIIYSFPILHTLEVYNCKNGTTESIFAGSKYIKSIKAARKNKKRELTNDEQFKYFMDNNSYSAIIYDKYRKCYYRIAEQSTLSSQKTFFKQNSIIILNENLEKIGEHLLPLRYGTTLLIAPEGILIPYIPPIPDEDESLNFHLFNLVAT